MEIMQGERMKTMLLELVALLKEVYSNKLKTVILYGSTARGTDTDESDIDVMVGVDGNNQELHRSFYQVF